MKSDIVWIEFIPSSIIVSDHRQPHLNSCDLIWFHLLSSPLIPCHSNWFQLTSFKFDLIQSNLISWYHIFWYDLFRKLKSSEYHWSNPIQYHLMLSYLNWFILIIYEDLLNCVTIEIKYPVYWGLEGPCEDRHLKFFIVTLMVRSWNCHVISFMFYLFIRICYNRGTMVIPKLGYFGPNEGRCPKLSQLTLKIISWEFFGIIFFSISLLM